MNPTYDQLINGLRRRMTMDEVISKLPGAKPLPLPDRRAYFERNSIQRTQFDAPDFLEGLDKHQQNVTEVKQQEMQQEKGSPPEPPTSTSSATKVTNFHYDTTRPRPTTPVPSFDISGDPSQTAVDEHMTHVDDTLTKNEDDTKASNKAMVKGVQKHLMKQTNNVVDNLLGKSNEQDIDPTELQDLKQELEGVNLEYVWNQVSSLLGTGKRPMPKKKNTQVNHIARDILRNNLRRQIKLDEAEEPPTEKEKQERQKQLDSMTVSGSSSSGRINKPKDTVGVTSEKALNIRETETGKRARTRTDDGLGEASVPSIDKDRLPNPINTADVSFWKTQSAKELRLQLALRRVNFDDALFQDSFFTKSGTLQKKKSKATATVQAGKGKSFLLDQIQTLIDSNKWLV